MKTLMALAVVLAAAAATAPASLAGTQQGYHFITDTLGGNGHPAYNPNAYVEGGAPAAVATAIQAQGRGMLAGDGRPAYNAHAYVYGGASSAVAKATQALGKGHVSPLVVSGGSTTASGGSSFSWGDAGIGAAAWTGVLLVLIGGSLVVLRRRGVLAH